MNEHDHPDEKETNVETATQDRATTLRPEANQHAQGNGTLVAPPPDAPPVNTIQETYGITEAEYAVLRATVCKDAPRAMAAFFMIYCKRQKLDPFGKQVYLMNVGRDDRPDWQIVTGIQGFRAIAARNPAYRGIDEPEWTYLEDEQGNPLEFTKDDSKWGEIAGKLRVDQCKVRVWRTPPGAPWDCPRDLWLPIVGVIRFDEFVQRQRDGKIKGAWEKAPENQSAVRAEAQAWRRAFPEDLGGLLTFEEADDIRARNDEAPATTNGAAALLEQQQQEGRDPDPEDAEIDALAARDRLNWTRAFLGSQLARFRNDKAQLLEHMRKTWEKQQDTARHRARNGDQPPPQREPETFVQQPDPAAAESAPNDAYDQPGSIQNGTRKELFKMLNDVVHARFPKGIREKADRLVFARENGVEIDSYTKISENQARHLIDVIARWREDKGALVPSAPESSGQAVVKALRCDACNAKRGETHTEGCPIDETDEPEVIDGEGRLL